jgi:hypothetical protein
MKLSEFKQNEVYKYIGKADINTPGGVISRKRNYVFTGAQWIALLVYDFAPGTAQFKNMFKRVKHEKNKRNIISINNK